MSETVSLIDRQQERDARALMRLIHDGEIDKFATEITARWERNERLRASTPAKTGAVGTETQSVGVHHETGDQP